MAAAKYAPSQFVKVPVPVGTSSATMAFGDEELGPAFIQNERGRRDRVETYAMRRLPNLRSGSRVTVRVYHADGVAEITIQVA